MPVSIEEFCDHFPRLYHMADKDAWVGIQRHGLLSTSGLLDLFEIDGEQRQAIESRHRQDSVTIEHPKHGRAVIRDQKPMSEGALRKCLRGMSPRQWYRVLNRKVFFWTDRGRLSRLLTARAYRATTHCVLTIESAPLLAQHLSRIALSPINSGSTIFNPQPRGAETFLPLEAYPFDAWAKKRGSRMAVAELAVEYQVPDICEFAVRVEEICGRRVLKVLLER